MAKDPDTQHQLFRQAVEALGGPLPFARKLGFSERHGQRLYYGDTLPHEGILRDTATALLEHAELCRRLESELTPAFTANLTEHQLAGDNRGRHRRGARKEAE